MDTQTALLQESSTTLIVFHLVAAAMRGTVNFNDQRMPMANEIHNVRPDRNLSVKFVAVEMLATQVKPKPPLSFGWFSAHALGAGIGEWSGHGRKTVERAESVGEGTSPALRAPSPEERDEF